MYRISLALAIFGTILYHLSQKLTSRTVDPFLSLAVTYGVALFACLSVLVWRGHAATTGAGWGALNWASVVCGVAIFLVEVGVLLAYRAGWDLKTLGLVSNTCVAVLLVPLGLILFRETLNLGSNVTAKRSTARGLASPFASPAWSCS